MTAHRSSALHWALGMPVSPVVPVELSSRPFRGSEAVALGLLTRAQLRSSCWTRLLRDVYVHYAVEITGDIRLEALMLVAPPTRVVVGRTAAWLYGVWIPAPGQTVPLEVSDPVPARGGASAGLARRRLTLRGTQDWQGPLTGMSQLDRDVIDIGGLAVVSPVRACFDLMRERRLVEAVVVADAFLWTGAVDPLVLAMYAADRRRWPNVRTARFALSLAVPGSRSPGESRLRMILVLAGLPEPLVNVPVYDGCSDRVIGIPDLTVVGKRTVWIEYDGAYHEEDEQQARDRRRENGLAVRGGTPLLRYDSRSVAVERSVVLSEVCDLSGCVRRNNLDALDFVRPTPARRW